MATLLRRAKDQAAATRIGFCAGASCSRSESYELRRGSQPIALTRIQFRLLHLLAANSGTSVPYSRLVEYAWGDTREGPLVKTHVAQIGDCGLSHSGPASLASISGVGTASAVLTSKVTGRAGSCGGWYRDGQLLADQARNW